MISRVHIAALYVGLAVAATLAATPAVAVTKDQIKQCDGAGDATAEQRMAACDAIIAGSHNARQRATAQRNKAKFAKNKSAQQQRKATGLLDSGKDKRARGDADGAIKDFDEAIALDAKNAE